MRSALKRVLHKTEEELKGAEREKLYLKHFLRHRERDLSEHITFWECWDLFTALEKGEVKPEQLEQVQAQISSINLNL